MDPNDTEDLKILIDALKYTSNIIVGVTNKLTEQDEKIERLENNLNKLYKLINNKSINNNLTNNKSTGGKNTSYPDDFDNEIEKVKYSDLNSFVIEKTKDKTQIKNLKNTNQNNDNLQNDSIPKDRNKIDKLINSIVKRKKILSDMIGDNKEKSLLTDYNTFNNIGDSNENDEQNDNLYDNLNDNYNQNNKQIDKNIDFSIRTVKTNDGETIKDGETTKDEKEDTKTSNVEILKTIRKRSNFAKRL